ncbi:MAG: Fe-S cluster assembly sulfur transfer protein SufU [Candidatus Micrarchaeaceae archaeon]|jgi:nitrogen fixation protein NifU and related proteins
MDLYAEEIISHYEHPHNKGEIKNPSISVHEHNPLCGDDLTIYLEIEKNRIKEVKFNGNGCAISMASASMLTDEIKGKTLDEIEKMGLKDIIDLLGIDPGPARLKCATLSLKTLKEASFMYQHKKVDNETKQL